MFLCDQVYLIPSQNYEVRPETMNSITTISTIRTKGVEERTPTFDRPRTATSGDSAGGNCENFPTVKRKIGAGAKSFEERWICF